MTFKKKLVFCSSKVNASNIKRESRDGVEHIIITSYTLPPDIVMNRGLYPADEVTKSFATLERTLAPIEHPEVNGQFISAADPFAINNFYGGAWNEDVKQMEDGRIRINKVVNVQKALDSDKGKRLLDRINAMEDGSDNRPMHTSVGVYLEVEPLGEAKTNAAGDEYDWIAKNMFFDHDAILLDSVGAATPSKGVGIGVNKESVDVEYATFKETDDYEPVIKANDLRTNKELSFHEIHDLIYDALNSGIIDYNKKSWVLDVFDDTFIYETPSDELFRAHYSIDDNGNLEIQDTRLPVERVVEYKPINQPTNENEDDAMRDKIIAELKKLGFTANAEMSDDDLVAKYNELLAANAGSEPSDDSKEPKANADDSELAATVKDQATEIAELKANAKVSSDAAISKKITTIQANEKYSSLSEAALKAIHSNSAEEFETMYTESIPSYGIGNTNLGNVGADDQFSVNTDIDKLPE